MRTDAIIIVTCDLCDDTIEMPLQVLASGNYTDAPVTNALQRRGWATKGEKDYCPDCKVVAEEGDGGWK